MSAGRVDIYTRALARPDALSAALAWYRAATPFSLRAPRVDVPTLYVWGSGDPALGPRATATTGRWVSGAYRSARSIRLTPPARCTFSTETSHHGGGRGSWRFRTTAPATSTGSRFATVAANDLALIEATTDAGQSKAIEARRNTSTPVRFPLAGALHVRLTMQNLAPGGFRDVTAAFGDAKFACGE